MAEETPRRASAWGIVIASVVNLLASMAAIPAVILAGKALFPHPSPPVVVALLIGETILVPLAVWLVFHLAYRRHRSPRRPMLTFVVILAGTLVLNGALGGLAVIGMRHDEAERIATRTTDDDTMLRTVLDESNAAASALNVGDDTPVNLHTGAPGEAGRIARGARAMLRGLNAARQAFNTLAHTLDYPGLMAPAKLEKAGRLEAALTVFAKIRTAQAVRDTQIDAAEADYRALLAGARIDTALRQDALAYLDHQIAIEKASRAKYDEFSYRILDELTAEIHDLQASRPIWSVRNGAILFAGQGDYDRYNRHQHAVSALARQIQKLTVH